jgi:acylphosphatase
MFSPAGVDEMSKREALTATVTGNDEQVGFRALVMKQAIRYNLAGAALNQPDDVVRFTLQGKKKRINSALKTIKQGNAKTSGIKIATSPAAFDPSLNNFTIFDWTSASRSITTPYTLVFHLRANDEKISQAKAAAAWHQMLLRALDPADLKKLRSND